MQSCCYAHVIQLVQKEPPFSIGRVQVRVQARPSVAWMGPAHERAGELMLRCGVRILPHPIQYALTSPLLALACSSNILVLVLAGSLTPPSSSLPATPPRIVRIDLNDPDKERTVDLYAVTASSSASSSGSSAPSKEGSAATGTTSSGQRGNQTAGRQDPTSIHRLFLDPSGRHVIVSTAAGESYYFFSGWEGTVKRARTLPKLRGIVINAVSWNSPLAQSSSQVAQTTTSTKEILLGDTKGNIYECVIDAGVGGEEGSVAATALRPFGRGGNLERHFKLVYSLVDKSTSLRNATSGPSETYAITGLRSEIWAGAGAGQQQQQKRKAVVVATTATRIYQFVASVPASAANVSIAERDEGGMYDDLFKVYRDSTPSELNSTYPKPGAFADSLLMVAMHGNGQNRSTCPATSTQASYTSGK